ncbi:MULTISPECIES: phage tail assembly chaperone [Comamonadaceae]|uniref:phage tail assembly chaperone n=1 Tax=Acidovorax sacchari TaxID=3230736 RepID=UPI0034A3A430
MAKIVLGKRPESFKRKVSFPMLDGSTGVIHCEFFYRTKSEFGQLVDEIAEAAAMPVSGSPGTISDILGNAVRKNGDYLLKIVKDWDLEGVEVNAENATRLADEIPGGATAIFDAYREGCVEGKLGN